MENREIKFRVWNSAAKKWFEPVYEAYQGKLHDISISLSGQVIERTLDCCSDLRNTCDFVIQQYSGLKDKNGKEIYEGDIVRHSMRRVWQTSEHISIVEWDTKWGAFYFIENGIAYKRHRIRTDMNLEIIGNIYENPELLTQLNKAEE